MSKFREVQVVRFWGERSLLLVCRQLHSSCVFAERETQVEGVVLSGISSYMGTNPKMRLHLYDLMNLINSQ